MKLVVISPEQILPEEADLVGLLFRQGLQHYHVRKPSIDSISLGLWLSQFPAPLRARMVLHQHHHLARALGLGGLHWKDTSEAPSTNPAISYPFLKYSSRSCHNPDIAQASLGVYDSLLLAPIYPPLSKPDRQASSHDWTSVLRNPSPLRQRTCCLALGGITPDRIPACHAQGFDGVAVLGALWHSPAPLATFRSLQSACQACR